MEMSFNGSSRMSKCQSPGATLSAVAGTGVAGQHFIFSEKHYKALSCLGTNREHNIHG